MGRRAIGEEGILIQGDEDSSDTFGFIRYLRDSPCPDVPELTVRNVLIWCSATPVPNGLLKMVFVGGHRHELLQELQVK
jgi:hypothetical protein